MVKALMLPLPLPLLPCMRYHDHFFMLHACCYYNTPQLGYVEIEDRDQIIR
jgi:hypothetical protein